MDKFLISKNKAIKLLDTNYFIFKNEIEPQLELVSLGSREKVVVQSIFDYLNNAKYKLKKSDEPAKHDEQKSLCIFPDQSSPNKKVKIKLE